MRRSAHPVSVYPPGERSIGLWFSVQSCSASVGGWSAIALDQPLLASVSVIVRGLLVFAMLIGMVAILPCHRCSAVARSTPERLKLLLLVDIAVVDSFLSFLRHAEDRSHKGRRGP